MRLTVKEYANRSGIGMSTAYRYVNQNKVPSTEIDGVRYVILSESEARELKHATLAEREKAELHRLSDENTWLRSQVESLQAEMSESRKRTDAIVLDLTRQLENQRQAIENRQRRRWWHWWR